MRSLRSCGKRTFGTAPTIPGSHGSRKELRQERGTIPFLQQQKLTVTEEYTEEITDYVMSVGEFIVFRETNGYPFNLLQLTENYSVDNLSPRKKLKGNFLPMRKLTNSLHFVCLRPMRGGKGGSVSFTHVMRDEDDKVVTAERSLCIILQDATFCQMDLEVFRELELLSATFEESSRNMQDRNDDRPAQETDVQEYSCDEGGREKEKEPQPAYTSRRDRRGRGNRYASVMNFLLN